MFTTLRAIARDLRRDEDGATMVEYGLLVALIAMVALAGCNAEIRGSDSPIAALPFGCP